MPVNRPRLTGDDWDDFNRQLRSTASWQQLVDEIHRLHEEQEEQLEEIRKLVARFEDAAQRLGSNPMLVLGRFLASGRGFLLALVGTIGTVAGAGVAVYQLLLLVQQGR